MNAPSTSTFPNRSSDQPPRRWVHSPIGRLVASTRRYWRDHALKGVDYEAVVRKVQDESGLTWRYIFMTCMSAGIAVLGLLLSSPAVVIGAMLLSPLMGPILGAGFALAIGDFPWLRASGWALLVGSLVAVAFTGLIVLFSPLQTVTGEIAARTRPNLFDLLVALFSALAGAYAMIRGREGTIVGVAIATALMPPLAVVGFGLATFNGPVFSGSLLLFVTNLVTIALMAALMARLYGFSRSLSPRQTMLQTLGIILALLLLAVPLGLALRQIALEANAQRLVAAAVDEAFDDRARVDAQRIDWDTDPITVMATVFTPEFIPDVDAQVAAQLSRVLGQPVEVRIEQLQVGAAPGAAAQAALNRARVAEQAAASARQVEALTDRLALIAGTDREAVTVDRENRRAFVTARPLDGLTLAGWRELEQRATAELSGWQIVLRPPLAALPVVEVENGELTERGDGQVDLIAWAAQRSGLPVALRGGGQALDEAARRLRARGVAVVEQAGGPAQSITATWSVDQAATQ